MALVMFGILMTLVIKCLKTDRKNAEVGCGYRKKEQRKIARISLTSAARLFREQGISATGVDSITEDAGLHSWRRLQPVRIQGSHCGRGDPSRSGEIKTPLAATGRAWGKKKVFPSIVAQYLSPEHRDSAGRGCVVAALGSEIARQPRRVRDAFTREFKHSLDFLAELMRQDDPSCSKEDAIAAFVSMVGALILARAVSDETLSHQILKTTAKRVTGASGRPANCPPHQGQDRGSIDTHIVDAA